MLVLLLCYLLFQELYALQLLHTASLGAYSLHHDSRLWIFAINKAMLVLKLHDCSDYTKQDHHDGHELLLVGNLRLLYCTFTYWINLCNAILTLSCQHSSLGAWKVGDGVFFYSLSYLSMGKTTHDLYNVMKD